jgi:predicted transcriptional regulator
MMGQDTKKAQVLRTIYLDKDLDSCLRTLSFWQNRPKGDIMREAIAAYVAAEIGPEGQEAYIARRMGVAPTVDGDQ